MATGRRGLHAGAAGPTQDRRGAAGGRPRVAASKRSLKAKSNLARTLARRMTRRTLDRDSTISWPLRNEDVVCRRRNARTESPSVHSRCRRIPVSRAGIIRMKRRPSARWWRVIATSSVRPLAKPGVGSSGRERAQVEAGGVEDAPRQPAGPAAQVAPDVLENIGHLQAMTVGDRLGRQLLAPRVDCGGIVAKQLGQHLGDDAGDAIAVAVQLGNVPQAVGRRLLLELHHAPRHDPDAALDGAPLAGAEAVGDTHDAGSGGRQIALGLRGRRRKRRTQIPRERHRFATARHHLDEAFRQRLLSIQRQGGLVLYGVRDTAQEIGVAHHVAQRVRKLGNRQGEGARDALQHLRLKREIRGRRAARRGGRHHAAAARVLRVATNFAGLYTYFRVSPFRCRENVRSRATRGGSCPKRRLQVASRSRRYNRPRRRGRWSDAIRRWRCRSGF